MSIKIVQTIYYDKKFSLISNKVIKKEVFFDLFFY